MTGEGMECRRCGHLPDVHSHDDGYLTGWEERDADRSPLFDSPREAEAFHTRMALIDEAAENDEPIPYWTCPYLARYESRPGHDPHAVCAFGCWDEPACVTGGPWTDAE